MAGTLRFPCPKCGRSLEPSGEVVAEGHACPVYQCDECLANVELMGVPVEVALTFAVGPDGKAFDPATEDGSLPLE